MTNISLIVAMDEAQGIGINNQLLVHLPADLKYFKSVTMGKPIIMGRLTYESIGRPLPGRKNIVVSSRLASTKDLHVTPTLQDALELAHDTDEVFIIGGASLYQEAIQSATRLYVTKIHTLFKADVFFPLINSQTWECIKQTVHEHDEQNPFNMTFCIYERINKSWS